MSAIQATQRFIDQTDRIAKKHNMKVSISVPGEKEVVIADHTPPENNEAQVLLDLESLIKTNVDNLSRAKSEIKKLNEMVESALMNDEAYRTAKEDSTKTNKQRLSIKVAILSQPANKQLVEKIKELKEETKGATGAQSDYLREYHRMSGSTQLELFDGQMMEIVPVYKLIKRGK